MEHDSTRQLVHDIRGCLNSLRLCLSVLETITPEPAQLQFLDDLIVAAQKLDELMIQLHRQGRCHDLTPPND